MMLVRESSVNFEARFSYSYGEVNIEDTGYEVIRRTDDNIE